MREMYRNEADSSPTSPESSLESSVQDPFCDRFPWFKVIGRAFLYLSNLLYSITLVQKIPIANEKGDVIGFLRVALQPVTGEKHTLPRPSDLHLLTLTQFNLTLT